jgi:hypothetical protein
VWLWLLFKVLFTQKSMPTIFFYFLKIIFEIAHQDDLKTSKTYYFKKKKNSNFLKSNFQQQCQTPYRKVSKGSSGQELGGNLR